MKEIEKLGVKKGVIIQAIKDVNQSLVDDNLVESDKIGIGSFFWALPSMGFSSRENLLKNIDKKCEDQKAKIDEIKAKTEAENDLRTEDAGDGLSRKKLMEEF